MKNSIILHPLSIINKYHFLFFCVHQPIFSSVIYNDIYRILFIELESHVVYSLTFQEDYMHQIFCGSSWTEIMLNLIGTKLNWAVKCIRNVLFSVLFNNVGKLCIGWCKSNFIKKHKFCPLLTIALHLSMILLWRVT